MMGEGRDRSQRQAAGQPSPGSVLPLSISIAFSQLSFVSNLERDKERERERERLWWSAWLHREQRLACCLVNGNIVSSCQRVGQAG